MVCSALVFFLQAGFTAVETGSVRYKNSINVALKNVIDLCCSFAAFFVIGYSLMFGASVTVGGWASSTRRICFSGRETRSLNSAQTTAE